MIIAIFWPTESPFKVAKAVAGNEITERTKCDGHGAVTDCWDLLGCGRLRSERQSEGEFPITH